MKMRASKFIFCRGKAIVLIANLGLRDGRICTVLVLMESVSTDNGKWEQNNQKVNLNNIRKTSRCIANYYET